MVKFCSRNVVRNTAAVAALAILYTTNVSAQRPLTPSADSAAKPSAQPSALPANALYVPHRVARGKSFTDFEGMLQDLATADAVFLGEQHDDRGTHALQLAVLEGLARRNVQVVLALEMFERDVQPALDAYLAGTLPESAFLAQSRPWPNYGPDYRPMLEFAKSKGWPVIASNVPRSIASMVSRGGLAVLDTLGADRTAWVAAERRCAPGDTYAKKFTNTMEDMGGHGSAAMPPEMIGRFYEAQCVKDETMAESITRAFTAHSEALVVHVAGGFHVEQGLGTVERVVRRVKAGEVSRKVSRFPVVMFVPTANLDSAKAGADRHLGTYVVYPIK